MTSKSKKPLPLSDILRDLALLRASDHDIPEIFKETRQPTPASASMTVADSYNYVATVRAALKLKDFEKEGKRIEEIRNKYEELVKCLDDHQ